VSPRRHPPVGVTPIELWDHEVDGQMLFRLVGARDGRSPAQRAATLRRALPELMAKTGADRVWLGGGLAQGLRDHLPEVHVVSVDVAWRGAQTLGADVMLDLGQTSIKLHTRSWRLRLLRPARVPVWAHGEPRPGEQDAEAALSDWLHTALRLAGPGARVIGLPCTISADLACGASSYAGLTHSLVQRLPEALLLNDAELAGLGAVAAGAPPRTLLITLGYAPGGALLG
jgi:hypothetical protein